MRYVVLPLLASVAFASPALADDFAGPYVGAGVTLDNVQGSGAAEGVGFSGIGGTVFAGYDLPVGDAAFAGVEANFDASTADVSGVKADLGWGVSGRLGYKLNDKTALYGRVGFSQGRIDYAGPGDREWLNGVKYGLGIQTAVTDQVSLRAEVNQINYEQDVINNQAQLSLSYGF